MMRNSSACRIVFCLLFFCLLSSPKVFAQLPAGWTSEDIGDPGAAGSTVIANGALTITGSGNDIWYNADDFHYYYKTLSGDIDAIIKVDSFSVEDTDAKVGIMIRESNADNSKHVSVFVHDSNNFGVGLQRRTSTGGGSAATNIAGTVPPAWLRLVKSGDSYTAYQSADGVSWTQVGETLTVSMSSALVGIAMCSNIHGALASATITESNFFDLGEEPVITAPAAPTNLTTALISNEIQLDWTDNADDEDGFIIERKINTGTYTWLDSLAANATSYADTTVSAGNTYTYRINSYNTAGNSAYNESNAIDVPGSGGEGNWISEDIGAVSAAGAATVANGMLTIKGSGADIGGTADEFFYYYKNTSGDIDVSAKINSLLNASAKAGIMIRESNAANSTYLMVAVTSAGEATMEGRGTTGGSSTGNIVAGVALPRWIRITRAGNTFNGYYSADGQNWTAIGTPVVLADAPVDALLGFAITSRSDGNFAEATITESNFLDLGEEPVITAPEAPTNLTAALISNEIQLGWTDNADDEDGFLIERKTNTGTYTWLDSLAANATSYADTTVSAGNTYTYRINSYNAAGNSTYNESNAIDVPGSTGSENWTFEDIGDPGAAGSTVIANGALTITGSGNDIWYNVDDFHYYYKTLSGDIDAIIKVDSFTTEDTGAKVGIMIRESNAANSKHVTIFIHDGNNYGVGLQRRTSTGGGSAATNVGGTVPPGWLRLVKSGDSYTAYQSADGVSWIQVGETLTVNMSSALVGIAMTSNTDGILASATITESNFFDLGEEPVITAPAAPGNFSATVTSGNTVQLTWADNSNDENGFIIERKTNTGTYTWLDSLAANTTSYADAAVSPGNIYTYRIKAVRSGFYSAWVESSSVTVSSPSSTGGAIDDAIERQVLSELYDALGGDNWSDKTNWKNELQPLEDWHGITVTNGDVTEINLSGNNLKGRLPNSLHLLEALQVINLSNNQIEGELPVQMARLPELEALYLDDNELGGIIDLEYSVMPSLEIIHLQNNNFRSIPDYSFNEHVDKSQVSLKAENNKLEFLYIENNLNLDVPLQEFTYSPQKPYGTPKVMGFIVGNRMELKIKMLGQGNVYQWEFDDGTGWTPVGAGSSTYEVAAVSLSDAGRYRCRISNTIEGTGFEIISEEIEVKVDGGIVTEIDGVKLINYPLN